MNPFLNQPFDDIYLVRKLQKGDIEAFDLIYEKYSKKLYRFGLKYLQSKAEAEELVQSVFLKIWENHKHIDQELSFKSYLFTIAYNDICKLFRRRNYKQKFIKDLLSTNHASSSQTENDIDYQSTLDRLTQIVEELPSRQKVIFSKSRQEGKTTKEIAEELNLSPGTVDNYISAALTFIRNRLHKEDIALMLLTSLYVF